MTSVRGIEDSWDGESKISSCLATKKPRLNELETGSLDA